MLAMNKKIKIQEDYDVALIGPKYINGIRSGNYDYKTALSELIDNSQDASATQVMIDFLEEKKNKMKAILIADNGIGMDFDELKNSFSLGADRRYTKNCNGRFGMGGTNGALSMARVKITVSKKNGKYNIRSYDLDRMEEMGTWGSFHIKASSRDGSQYIDSINKYLDKMDSESGTLIILKDLDRMSNHNIAQVCATLKKKYAETYYHSLYTETLKIVIQGDEVRYEDPLLWDHENIIHLVDEWIVKPSEGYAGIKLRAVSLYNLQPKSRAYNKLNTSGGYIFRNHRMVQQGIFKNARWPSIWEQGQNKRDIRWSLNFSEDDDALMSLSNSKDSVTPSADIEAMVAKILNPHAEYYSRLRDSRDRSQTEEESKKDLEAIAQIASQVLKMPSTTSQNINPTSVGGETKTDSSPVDRQIVAPKSQIEIVDVSCGPYHGPLIIEPHPDKDSIYQWIGKINIDNDYIKNHYNNKSAETKESVRILLVSSSFALHKERLRNMSEDICLEVVDNVDSAFVENLRRLTRRLQLQ